MPNFMKDDDTFMQLAKDLLDEEGDCDHDTEDMLKALEIIAYRERTRVLDLHLGAISIAMGRLR